MIKSIQTFHGVALRGSLQGHTKHGRNIAESSSSEMETAVNLTTKGLCDRLQILLSAKNQPSDVTSYGPKLVINMLVFTVGGWPTRPSHLIDYGREETGI